MNAIGNLRLILAGTIIAITFGTPKAQPAELQEPLTLSSDHGQLNLLMIAKSAPVSTIPGVPTGWVYEICKRPSDGLNSCPQAASDPNYYGGTLLRLQAGDNLRIHLVNQLPPVLDSDHAQEPGHEFLQMNPTNIHTHGMLVAPRTPTPDNPTYGDNVFVLTFNSANGKPEPSPHMHSAIRYDFTDYEIQIPKSHPSGLFWFHPHAHGLALNQVSAGLSGVITVGNLSDYLCRNDSCNQFLSEIAVRHMLLKDTQVEAGGQLQDQEDSEFCGSESQKADDSHDGSCDEGPGDDDNATQGRGKWYFTLNGQVYPTIPIRSRGGEIWRLTNASGSVTYDLSLWNATQGRDMLFQVLSLDGVSVKPTAGITMEQGAQIAAGKFKPEACPGWAAPEGGPDGSAPENPPLCTRRLHMMPSSRVEVWVSYRDKKDRLASPPKGSFAVFRTNGYNTGESGDTWPRINLGRVEFQRDSSGLAMPKALSVKGEAVSQTTPLTLSADLAQHNASVHPDKSCHTLPPGHMRRIFYGVPSTNPDAFGLAYEELDEHGNVVGPPATDLIPFDPMYPTVCVPLGPGNRPAVERWQLVNTATEDHNFHIHQVKFRVLSADEIAGTESPKGIMLDNAPLRAATGACGNNPPNDLGNPISNWRAGLCKSDPITVEIPFTIAGDFVYHCHILEHEDGGMMARIRVRSN